MSSATRRTLTIGLVGCGDWGRHILRDLIDLCCTVVVVAPDDRSRANAAERDVPTVATTAELPRVDGFVIATPSSSHAQVVAETLGRGVPVFVEKPMTDDPASAESLAASGGDRLFVMDKWRYHPGIEALAVIARSKELGATVGLASCRNGRSLPYPDVDVVWILAPHELSIGLEILGEIPTPRAAVADLSNDGVVGMTALLGVRPWHSFELSARSPNHRRRVTLYASHGMAVLADAASDHLEIYRGADSADPDGPEPERLSISTEMPLLRELAAFVEHLRGGPPPRSSAMEGVAVVTAISELRSLAGIG